MLVSAILPVGVFRSLSSSPEPARAPVRAVSQVERAPLVAAAPRAAALDAASSLTMRVSEPYEDEGLYTRPLTRGVEPPAPTPGRETNDLLQLRRAMSEVYDAYRRELWHIDRSAPRSDRAVEPNDAAPIG
jgi:hypothetical protein